MFTGLVHSKGVLVKRVSSGDSASLVFRYDAKFPIPYLGDSISINGVCLTVSNLNSLENLFEVDVMGITLNLTNLDSLAEGSIVNLEPAMSATDRFGGHIVQGHIDGKTQLKSVTPHDNWLTYRFALPESLSQYFVVKGSICVNGVSLTLSDVGTDWFEVSLIPTTLEITNLGMLQVGDWVNLEVDLIAKYVESILRKSK